MQSNLNTMAVNENAAGRSGDVSDLLNGWSFVVHHPSEDPEPANLPSTVDMAAFSAGPNEQQSHDPDTQQCSDSESDSASDSENSGSDASWSGSTSDSESSSSSQCSAHSNPSQFNLTSMQTGGLKLKIAAVRKSCDSPEKDKPDNDDEKPIYETTSANNTTKNVTSDRSSDSESDCSDSDSSTDTESQSTTAKSDTSESKQDKKGRTTKPVKNVVKSAVSVKNNVSAQKKSAPLSKSHRISSRNGNKSKTNQANANKTNISTKENSDSDEKSDSDADSVMLASCSLQEIRQEDLAAILPDQQDCDAFGVFECETRSNKNLINETADASGSDMELPPQLVTAAIQRATECTSDGESSCPPQPTLYASSLLQQFEVQTQMLSTTPAQGNTPANITSLITDNISSSSQNNTSAENVKRKRGRPKKNQKPVEEGSGKAQNKSNIARNAILGQEYCSKSNVSPDSGIQDSPERPSSPEPNVLPNKNNDKIKSVKSSEKNNKNLKKDSIYEYTEEKKCDIKLKSKTLPRPHLDRVLYANTDRVLYPPRRRVGRPPSKKFRRPGRPPKLKSNESNRNSQSLVEVPSEISRKSNINKELQKKLIKKSNKSGSKHYKLKNQQRKDHKIVDGSEQKVVINKKSESKKMIDYVPSKTTNHIVYLPSKSNNDSRNRNISSTVKIRKRPTYATHIRIKSKHKHHKHHKHRLKSHRPKPSQEDPKLLSEIDKLIADFIKFCSVGTNRNIMEKVAESIKCVKRASKKRKGSDNLEGRKKKKQCNVSNESESKGEHSSNEQRLPLKKRHYHISNGENKQSDTTTEPSRDSSDKSIVNVSTEEDIENKNEEKQKIVSEVDSKSTAESKETGKSTDTHIKEAIEACINRYNPTMTAQKNIHSVNSGQSTLKDVTLNQVQPNEPTKTNINIKGIMATTPKKRHRLETEIGVDKSAIDKTLKNLNISLNSQSNEKQIKLETKSNNNTESLQGNKKTPMKTPETIAQIKTRKKNRLEDLTSNLASKITPSSEALDSLMINNQKKSNKKPTSTDIKSDATVNRASVIKSPSVKKEERSEFDGNIVSDIPTGIFMPTVDIELQIPASTIINTSCELPKVQGTSQININCDTGVHNLRNKKINESVKSTTKIAKHGITKKEAEKETKKIEKETKKIEKETKKLEKEIKVQIEKTSKGNTEKNNARSVEKENDIKKPLPIEVATNETEKERSDKSKQYESQQKRIRRRKAINRTGFPTVKKKKKKLMTPSDNKDSTAVSKNNQNVYERVPKIGEKASTFVERTQKTRLTSIEKENENDKSERNESKSKFNLDLKSSNTYSRDNSPCSDSRPTRRRKSREPEESILKASERISRKIRDQSNDSLKSSDTSVSSKSRIKRKRNSLSRTSDLMYKKRLRDFSPASSIEPLPSDKRIRCDESASASGDDTRRSRKPPRWRKKYLVAGLFSDYFKEDDETARIRRAEASATKTKLIYKPEEHPHGLLPPPYHCGKWLRCRKTYFQLPHDLWWQHTHSRLPGRDLVPSWNYRKIRTNVYCTRPVNGVCEPQACNCSESTGCGDDCINRLVLSECPATHRCKNQKIQRHEWAPGLDKFMTEDKGWGVKTKLPIKSGEFILEYVGEVVSDKEFKHRMASRYAHDTHHYCLHLDGGLVIDGHRMGGDGRFVNHSCEPNCEMQKWSVNGQFRMALFALRDIEADEELTYDYNFSLFNPADGQVCKCGSDNCRGVIGGKSQRVKQPASESHSNSNGSGRIGRPRKNRARRTTSGSKDSVTEKNSTAPAIPSHPGSAAILPNIKPLTQQQKALVLERHCFLIKNLNKIKQMRERSLSIVARSTTQNVSENNHVGAFLSHLNALRQPRNIKTRRLAQAEENPELSRAARLASVFRDLYNAVVNAKDEKNQLFSTPFMTLPTKRKQPEYYQRVSDPIDLSTIHQNIENGKYPTVEKFDSDVSRVFDNAVKYFGRTSELGIAATRLRKVYGEAKVGCVEKLKEILGEKPPVGFVASQDPGAEEEDVIRCICGLYRDEGLMIQCERCLVWQHCECVKADEKAPSYLCERCQPRNVDYEIPLNEFTEHGHRFYMSLMRKDLQLRQGDTVYVLRDISIEGTNRKHTYETIGDIDFTELDIFRIERLWKDKDTGQRMAYGHHYLRPHETYHEPTRKFFPNEVMRVPLYEAVPVELIMSRCWVMDINTFCKGRPMGAPEEHIYVCEYRVDKSARLFTKMTKTAYPICTKNYAFERFETRLKISRSYAPHELENAPVKVRGKRQTEEIKIDTKNLQVHMPVMRSLAEQKTRLNSILLKLLANLPTKQPLDVSYLLEGGRRRKKPQS